MKRVLDTMEVLGWVETPRGSCEVCVSAEANYDESAGRLIFELHSFLRTANLRAKERQFSAEWAPRQETVTESVGPNETVEMARDIFHRWVRKVREAAPPLHGHTL